MYPAVFEFSSLPFMEVANDRHRGCATVVYDINGHEASEAVPLLDAMKDLEW